MKSKYEQMMGLRAAWYRDVHDFIYWENLRKNIF